MNINNQTLCKNVSDKTGFPKNQVKKMYEVLISELVENVSLGNTVTLRKFGSFKISPRSPRIARNPRTGGKVNVPAKNSVVFRLGRNFKASVNP